MGTFSKSLSPDLRIAYLVLPEQLLGRYRTAFPCANCTVPSLLQDALMQFLHSGEYQKHINAIRTHCRKKHDYILNYVRENLSGQAVLSGSDAGLHFILTLQHDFRGNDPIQVFAENRVKIYPLSPYWNTPASCPANQFLLGYGSISLMELPLAMAAIRTTID